MAALERGHHEFNARREHTNTLQFYSAIIEAGVTQWKPVKWHRAIVQWLNNIQTQESSFFSIFFQEKSQT